MIRKGIKKKAFISPTEQVLQPLVSGILYVTVYLLKAKNMSSECHNRIKKKEMKTGRI